jgi:hypothetical protein
MTPPLIAAIDAALLAHEWPESYRSVTIYPALGIGHRCGVAINDEARGNGATLAEAVAMAAENLAKQFQPIRFTPPVVEKVA